MKKVLIGFVIVIILILGGAAIALLTLDVDKFREQITSTLSEKTGRTIELSGPIKLNLSLISGVSLDLAGFSISNPSWASRPNMASIPHLDVGVAALPLLHGQILISHFNLYKADILLESDDNNRHNWDVEFVKEPSSAQQTKCAAGTKCFSEDPRKVSVNAVSFVITDSQISVRGDNGKITNFKVDNLTIKQKDGQTGIAFRGSLNAQPITLHMQTNDDDLNSGAPRPIKTDLTFANYHLNAEGQLSLGSKEVLLDAYELSAGKSALNGKLALEWGESHPSLAGTVNSDHLILTDFKIDKADTPTANTSSDSAPQIQHARMFSETPLGLKSLDSANATLDIAIKELVTGNLTLQLLDTKLDLKNGELFLSPLTANMGVGKISGQLHVNGKIVPPTLGLTLNATGIDMSNVLPSAAFISGKVNTDINLASSGDSLHELASNLSGTINLLGAGGDVVTRSTDSISSGFENLLNPGDSRGEENLNCMVARFIAAKGLVRDNGILFDTSAATVAGSGNIDLRGEIIDLQFRARPKLVNVSSLLPPMHVGGTLLNPETSINTTSVVQNVIGDLIDGTSLPSQDIPDVVAQQGQNACLAALNHPAVDADVQPNQKQGVVQKLGGEARQLLKGLFGK
jgi:uncharacterized protein involved in outer membrane biogenesis